MKTNTFITLSIMLLALSSNSMLAMRRIARPLRSILMRHYSTDSADSLKISLSNLMVQRRKELECPVTPKNYMKIRDVKTRCKILANHNRLSNYLALSSNATFKETFEWVKENHAQISRNTEGDVSGAIYILEQYLFRCKPILYREIYYEPEYDSQRCVIRPGHFRYCGTRDTFGEEWKARAWAAECWRWGINPNEYRYYEWPAWLNNIHKVRVDPKTLSHKNLHEMLMLVSAVEILRLHENKALDQIMVQGIEKHKKD